MSRRVFSFDPPDRFVCGAIGQPGQRTFFLQASKGRQVVSVALEKVQVAALAERLAALLLSLRERGVDVDWSREPDALPLMEPVFEQFRVGAMTLAWDEDHEQVLIEAREITDADLESEEDEDLDEASRCGGRWSRRSRSRARDPGAGRRPGVRHPRRRRNARRAASLPQLR